MAIAVCATVKVKPFSREAINFSLVWNMPNIYFSGDSEKIYKRFYTRYFPYEYLTTSKDISCYAAANQIAWSKEIKTWRTPILENKLKFDQI